MSTNNTPAKQVSISSFFNQSNTNNYLERLLGSKKGEFVSNVIALTEATPALAECEPASLMKCAMNATSLNLPLNKNLGYAYVIPYNNRKKGITEPQFQIGYKGFIQLAIRSAQYRTINACEVREGEIKRNKFTGEIEFLSENEESPVIGYLAYIKMLNGFEQSFYMSVAQVKAHADKYSKAFSLVNYEKLIAGQIPQNELWKYSSPWYDDFDGMAKKTVLKLLLGKYGLLSPEMQTAIQNDQTVNGEYADNPNNNGPRATTEEAVVVQDEPTQTAQPETVNLNDV